MIETKQPPELLYEFENEAYENGFLSVCGLDEAGRGPLAGPVYAAAVILPRDEQLEGVNDSKQLSARRREELYDEIINRAAAYSVAFADEKEIDKHNILQATFMAMRRAVDGLSIEPDIVLVDGNRDPQLSCEHTLTIVKGDARSASIAAASILAKVSRDRYMCELAQRYPQYGFEQHKGYPTKAHYEKLREFGPCPAHRESFLKKPRGDGKSRAANTGRLGEDIAARKTLERGMEIIARNYRCRGGEIDIIAVDEHYIAFIEVKARTEGFLSPPVSAVTRQKRTRIVNAAERFLLEHEGVAALQPRFDIVEVVFKKSAIAESTKISYLENAFTLDDL